MKLTVSNANITNTLSTERMTLANTNVVESITLGNVSVTPSQISVGNVSITPTTVSVPALVLGGSQFIGGLQGGIINYQEFTANGTWYNPYANASVNASLTGYEQVLVMAWGGGGGGGSNTSSSFGGGGGGFALGYHTLSSLSNTVSVIVGSGGAGIRTTTTAVGTATNGGNSSFGSLVAYGGAGCQTGGGGGGGGTINAAAGQVGGAPLGGAAANPGGTSTFGGGGGGITSSQGGTSIFGGGGGARGLNSPGGLSIYGGGGGTGNSIPGNSVFGGAGGFSGIAGSIPGGGGGSSEGAGGVANSGARGEVRVWVFGPAGTTAGAPTYTLTANTTSVYGGDSIVYTVATTNIANGTNLYYTLNNSSAAVSTDFSTAVNGSVVINGGTGTFTLTSNNRSYSSNTGMTFDIRSGSTTGPIVATNNSIVIRKTPTITYLGDYSQETGLGSDSTVTLTSQTLGVADATRRIVVAVARYRNDSALTPTVTVAGITATRLVGWAGNFNTTNIYIADVPTGTTGNIVATNAVDHYGGVTITWWALYDLGSSSAISTNEAHGTTSNRTLTLNTLNQSIVLFKSSRYLSNSPTTLTVSGTAGLTSANVDTRYDTTYYFYGSAAGKNMVSEGNGLTVIISPSSSSDIGASAIAIR